MAPMVRISREWDVAGGVGGTGCHTLVVEQDRAGVDDALVDDRHGVHGVDDRSVDGVDERGRVDDGLVDDRGGVDDRDGLNDRGVVDGDDRGVVDGDGLDDRGVVHDVPRNWVDRELRRKFRNDPGSFGGHLRRRVAHGNRGSVDQRSRVHDGRGHDESWGGSGDSQNGGKNEL
uniref:Uncharacterized protein n=1 Tax=Anopheles atroparvus TaxID=41427 RepID=A0A182JF57_ANOAO